MIRCLLIGLLAVSVGLTAGCLEAPNPQSLSVGEIAPATAGFDADNEPVALSEYRGKVVLLDFWATWCGPCLESLPKYQKLSEKMAGRPFTVLGVSGDYRVEDLERYLEAHPEYDWPNIFDGDARVNFDAWKIERLPTVHLIDAKGIIRKRNAQFDSEAELNRLVEELVREAEAAQAAD